MSKPIVFPDYTRFDQLFREHHLGYEVGTRWWPRLYLKPGERPHRLESTIGEYCHVRDGNSMHVRPTPEVVRSIRRDCVVPDAGPLCFGIVPRDDGTALVYWHYNSILGDRWLAVIDAKTIPEGAL